METLKVATHADELLLLNDIIVIHDDHEQGPVIVTSGLATCISQLKNLNRPAVSTDQQFHLDNEQQGNLVAIAQKVVGMGHNSRAASILFPLYRPQEPAFNLCLEMVYHFACHLEKFPTSPTTEATFVVHAVVSMLSPIQHQYHQHLSYDQHSKVIKSQRPDVRLIHNTKEILFAEVTSPVRAGDRKKVSVDLIRLGRFMKAAINNGVPKVVGIHVQGKQSFIFFLLVVCFVGACLRIY
jgi:hypothetical protein